MSGYPHTFSSASSQSSQRSTSGHSGRGSNYSSEPSFSKYPPKPAFSPFSTPMSQSQPKSYDSPYNSYAESSSKPSYATSSASSTSSYNSSPSSDSRPRGYQSPYMVKETVMLEASVMEKLSHNINLLQVILDYRFQTEQGLDCGKEALLHSTATTLPEGNLRLARLGESAMKTMGLERLYRDGNATGVNVTAQDHKFSIQNLCKVSKDHALHHLIIVGNSKPGISDRMSAQVLQAALGAIYIDGKMDALDRVMKRLGL